MEKETAKILVVDDQLANVEYIRRNLSELGYEVLGAYGGLDALRKVQQEIPDLILLDIVMPDLTGYEVCRALKIHPETSDIPVIFLTAKGEVYDKVSGLNLGAQDYVPKPFHPEELRARVRAALRIKAEQDKLKERTRQLAEKSISDELTGVYNNKYLMKRLKEELARASRYKYAISSLLIDIDYFKEINETLGKEKSDLVLKEIAKIIKGSVRAIDITARYGGGEFVVVLPQTGKQGSGVVAEKIRRNIESYPFYQKIEITKITASIGVAGYEEDNLGDVETLLQWAKEALAKAKTAGRNQVSTSER